MDNFPLNTFLLDISGIKYQQHGYWRATVDGAAAALSIFKTEKGDMKRGRPITKDSAFSILFKDRHRAVIGKDSRS
ncbi:hypothetical protein N657DRAFT_645757 [Parathielavia appendiculata]|uniref:Uncharacterized protein n=1 Tax=Parathielavia appendiculata TaxID=2587402 RepID=A0AAN6Z2Y2_9PEZI|nr:hypothetical protein N657DRAFT_645757 [Parathielavia appendiculata]